MSSDIWQSIGALRARAFVPMPRPARIPLSFSQERMYAFVDPEDGALQNRARVFEFKGIVDECRLVRAVTALPELHESLRTNIRIDRDGPCQIIQPQPESAVVILDCLSIEDFSVRLRSEVRIQFQHEGRSPVRFFIARLRVNLALGVVVSQIFFDGASWDILIDSLIRLYEIPNDLLADRIEIGITKPQFADVCVWSRAQTESTFLNAQNYWRNLFAKPVSGLFGIGGRASDEASTCTMSIESGLRAKLQALAHEKGISLFSILAAGLSVAM